MTEARSLAAKHLAVLSLILVTVLAGFFSGRRMLAEEQEFTEIINRAGRQRMLVATTSGPTLLRNYLHPQRSDYSESKRRNPLSNR